MGKNIALKILFSNLVLFVLSGQNSIESQKIKDKQDITSHVVMKSKFNPKHYKNLIVNFFNSIERATIIFSQFKDDKKIGNGFIAFDKLGRDGNFINIKSIIGEREFQIKGSSLDNMEYHDLYLDEKRKVNAPEIVKLLFSSRKDVESIVNKSFVTEKDGKIVCVIEYSDFTGSHKILLCFKKDPFTLTFWRLINRNEESSYIKVDDIRYNYKNS